MIQLFRNRNIANTLWNISDIFLYPVLFFGSTSFFIHKLGPDAFGVWMLINTIVVSMQLFNFGVGSSVFRNTALYEAQHNVKARDEMVSNALSLTLVLSGISMLLAVVVAYLVYSHGLLRVASGFRSMCAKGIILAGFIVSYKFCEQVFTSYFKAKEQFSKSMLIATGNKLAALLLNIALLAFLPLNIVHLLLVTIAVNLLFLLLAFYLLRRDAGAFRFTFNLRLPRQEMHFALFSWLQSLVILLTYQSDRYLIVNFFGLAALSYYALTATIFNHLHMGLNAVFPWLAPKLTRLYARNADGRDLYLAARNLLAVCSALCLLLLFLLYPFVFRIILGRHTLVQLSEYVRFFILFELFFAQGIVPTFYFNAMGQERRLFYFLLFSALLTVSAMLVSLGLVHQPLAVLYGLVAAAILAAFVQHMLMNKLILGRAAPLQALLLLLPLLLLSGFMLDIAMLKWIALPAGLLSIYLVYVRGQMSRFKTLFRS